MNDDEREKMFKDAEGFLRSAGVKCELRRIIDVGMVSIDTPGGGYLSVTIDGGYACYYSKGDLASRTHPTHTLRGWKDCEPSIFLDEMLVTPADLEFMTSDCGYFIESNTKPEPESDAPTSECAAMTEIFKTSFAHIAKLAHANAKAKGFHDNDLPESEEAKAQKMLSMIALMHSELSEATEAIRKGLPRDAHCPEFGNLEVELADVIIRIMDFAGLCGLDVGPVIVAKMGFNKSRPRKHGKTI